MSYEDPTPPQQQYPVGYPAQQPQIPAPGYGYDQQPPSGQVPPGYGPVPGYGQVPPGYPPVPPQQPKRRTGLFVGVGVAAGVVAVGLAFALTSGGSNKSADEAAPGVPSSPSPLSAPSSPAASASAADSSTGAAAVSGSITVPDAAGGLTKMTGSTADGVTSAMAKADASDAELSGAQFGAYEQTGNTSYYANLTLVALAEGSDVQELFAQEGASAAIKDIAGRALTKTATEPAAEADGAMTCGLLVNPSITLRACMWIDGNEYGLAALPETLSNSEAAQYSDALWKSSESSLS